MFELPRLKPDYVDDKTALEYNSVEFESGSGSVTSISTSRRGYGFTLSCRHEGLRPSESGEFLLFLNACRYDAKSRRSSLSFFVPVNHPLWERVMEKDYIKDLITTNNFDTAKWKLTNVSSLKTRISNVNQISYSIRNEIA